MSRCCVFINSNDPSIKNQLINTISFIKPKFPPKINLRELIMKQTYDDSNRASGRAPNAFIIYRKAFVEAARKDGYQLPMTIVSSMASKSWDLEPDNVKEVYKKLAKEANDIRNKLIPRLTCRRRRQKWNIVTFPPTTPRSPPIPKSPTKSPIPKSPIPPNNKSSSATINKSKSITEEKKSEVKETQSFFPIPTFHIPCDITSPIIDRFRFLDDSTLDNSYLSNSTQQQQQQQHQHQHFDDFIPPAYYHIGEQAVGTFTVNAFNTVDTEISAEYINNNEFFEQESSGFLSFFNDYEIPYPSFWGEF